MNHGAWRRGVRAGWTAAVALQALACSGSSSTGGGTPTDAGSGVESGAPDAGSQDSEPEGEGGACNTLANGAAVVAEENVNMNAPTPMGGPVSDGTFYLTAATVYTGPTGQTGPTGTTYQWTTTQTGDAYEVSLAITGPRPSMSVTNGTSMTSGVDVTFTQTCPALTSGATSAYKFDSDGTSVTLYTTGRGDVAAYKFTKH